MVRAELNTAAVLDEQQLHGRRYGDFQDIVSNIQFIQLDLQSFRFIKPLQYLNVEAWDSFVKKWRNLNSNLALTCIFYDPWCEIAEWNFMNPACQDMAGGQWLQHIWQHQVMLIVEVPETAQRKKVKHRIYIMELYSLYFNSFARFRRYNPKYSPVVIVFLQGLVTEWLELLDVKDSCPIVNYYGIKIHQLT